MIRVAVHTAVAQYGGWTTEFDYPDIQGLIRALLKERYVCGLSSDRRVWWRCEAIIAIEELPEEQRG